MANKTINRTPFAERLRKLRKAKGLNQREAAEAIGIDYENYRKYETVTYPKEDVYIKIADFYGITIDDLMGRTTKNFGEAKKVINTYSEKNNDINFIIRQSNKKIKVVENDLGPLSPLEILMLKKLRKLSNEDKNDAVQYLYNKPDM